MVMVSAFTAAARPWPSTSTIIMLNRELALFLTSFISVFASLVLISRYLNAKLLAAGYDISRIILIGLPTNNSYNSTVSFPNFAFPWDFNSNMTTQPSFDLNAFQEKGYAQAAALVLAVLSSIFIYFKFGAAGEFYVAQSISNGRM